jgi:hypothetical protein
MTSYQVQGAPIFLGGLPSTAAVSITNNGTITNAQTTVSTMATSPFTHQTYQVQFSQIENAIGGGATNSANTTITNNGIINGSIGLGFGTNVINMTTGSSTIGAINGTNSSNNTINLSGSGSGFVFGTIEMSHVMVTPPDQSQAFQIGATVPTFYGWSNIQNLNVNSGTWTLMGQGSYNNLTIAQNATFNICEYNGAAACSSYNGAQGTPQNNGLGPLNPGSGLTMVNNGTFNDYAPGGNSVWIDYVPGTPQFNVSGSGSMNLNGSQVYFAPTTTVTQGAIALSNGANVINAGAVSTGSLSVDSTSSLQVGSGGNLLNRNGQVVDDGTTGNISVTGNVLNAGSVKIDALKLMATGIYTQTAGTTILTANGTLEADSGINVNGGVIGGNGTLIGPVTLSGGTLQVGASPDALSIQGNFVQTGGEIVFEIDPNGSGGFLESTLNFQPGSTVSITDVDLKFDFLNGADALAFIAAGDFNLNTFVTGADLGTAFKHDHFSTNIAGIDPNGFDPATGTIRTVPEPSTLSMLLLGCFGAGFVMRRTRRKPRWRRSLKGDIRA